jgi:hypothetical protein
MLKYTSWKEKVEFYCGEATVYLVIKLPVGCKMRNVENRCLASEVLILLRKIG